MRNSDSRSKQQGSVHTMLLLLVVVLASVCISGWRVWSQQANKHAAAVAKQAANAASKSTAAPQPASFDECVRDGGITQSEYNIATTAGYNDALGAATCKMVYKNSQVFFAGNNARCSGRNDCYDIVAAARQACATPTKPDPGTDAVFRYGPVINGDYARMDLINCNHDYKDHTATKTIFLKLTNNKWSIYKVTGADILCTDVDSTGIPLGLDWTCTDDSGLRIVKN